MERNAATRDVSLYARNTRSTSEHNESRYQARHDSVKD